MTINIPKTIEQETTVPIPSFWRNGSDFVAIVDDDTAIALYAGSRLTCIRHADPEILRADIITAHSKWDLCEEVDFMEKYAEALKSISLKPVLTVGSLYNQDAEDARKAAITY